MPVVRFQRRTGASSQSASGVMRFKRRHPQFDRSTVAGGRSVVPGAARSFPLYAPPSRVGLMHYSPHTIGSTALDDNGVVVLLNDGIQAGTSILERVGNRINMHSMQFDCIVSAPTAPASPYFVQPYSWAIIFDRRPNGLLPSYTDVMHTAGYSAHLNESNRDRFVIVYQTRFFTSGADSANCIDSSYRMWSRKVVLGKQTVYTIGAATGAIGDIKEGCLYFVASSNVPSGLAASDKPHFQSHGRIFFSDL